ncbi:hypothetical protein V8C42DRAFT_327662 [Trichoderma barbatum]
MAKVFLITMKQVQPLPLFVFPLPEKEKNDTDYAIKAQIPPIPFEAVKLVDEDWKR